MHTTLHRRPKAWAILWCSLLLFALFLVQMAYQLYHVNRIHVETDEDLSKELAEATITEEEPSPTSVGWPQWRGPERTGAVSMPDLLAQWPEEGPPIQWETRLGIGYSSIAAKNGRLYSLMQEGEKELVVCWRIQDGKEVWRYPYESNTDVKDYPGPRSTPTLEGDRLYTVGTGGKLLCLQAADGTLLWQKDMLSEFPAVAQKWGVAFSPLIDGELLFVNPGGANGNSIAALNKNTGELVWKALDEPAGYSSPIAITIAGVRQIVFFLAKSLVGVRADNGKLCWRFPWETAFDVNAATPVALEARHKDHILHYVFISSGYLKGCALVKIAVGSGGRFEAKQVYVGNPMCSHFASPVRRGEFLFGIDDSRLVCLNVRTGKLQWTKPGINKGSLLRVNDYLLVLSENGKLMLLAASSERSEPIAEFRVFRNGRCWTMPSLANGFLLVRNEQQMKCFDLRNLAATDSKEKSRGE